MIKLGIYEQIVNEMIAAEIQSLTEKCEADLSHIDNAESAKLLGQYMGQLLT